MRGKRKGKSHSRAGGKQCELSGEGNGERGHTEHNAARTTEGATRSALLLCDCMPVYNLFT